MKQLDLFGYDDIQVKKDERYTEKVGKPIYTPSERCPHIGELTDLTKYKSLLRQISAADISEDEKDFLRLAAARHIVFHYSLIADYYAHADKNMQEQMERSALVIIDFDKAIELGYARFSKNIERIQSSTGRPARPETVEMGGADL